MSHPELYLSITTTSGYCCFFKPRFAITSKPARLIAHHEFFGEIVANPFMAPTGEAISMPQRNDTYDRISTLCTLTWPGQCHVKHRHRRHQRYRKALRPSGAPFNLAPGDAWRPRAKARRPRRNSGLSIITANGRYTKSNDAANARASMVKRYRKAQHRANCPIFKVDKIEIPMPLFGQI